MKVYKIRDIATGLFLGSDGRFTNRGKTWGNMGHAKNSYNCHKRSLVLPVEIVEYSVAESCRYRPTDEFVPSGRYRGKTRVWIIDTKIRCQYS